MPDIIPLNPRIKLWSRDHSVPVIGDHVERSKKSYHSNNNKTIHYTITDVTDDLVICTVDDIEVHVGDEWLDEHLMDRYGHITMFVEASLPTDAIEYEGKMYTSCDWLYVCDGVYYKTTCIEGMTYEQQLEFYRREILKKYPIGSTNEFDRGK